MLRFQNPVFRMVEHPSQKTLGMRLQALCLPRSPADPQTGQLHTSMPWVTPPRSQQILIDCINPACPLPHLIIQAYPHPSINLQSHVSKETHVSRRKLSKNAPRRTRNLSQSAIFLSKEPYYSNNLSRLRIKPPSRTRSQVML